MAYYFEVGVEILPPSKNLVWPLRRWTEDLSGLCEKCHVQILGIHSPWVWSLGDFIKNFHKFQPKDNLIGLASVLVFGLGKTGRTASIAQTLRVYYVVHPEAINLDATWVRYSKNILVENNWPESQYGKGIPAASAVSKTLGVGTVLDTSHCARLKEDILLAYQIMKPTVIHFSDSPLGEHGHLPWGEGEMPLRELLEMAAADPGFNQSGVIIVELRSPRGLEMTIQKVKNIIG